MITITLCEAILQSITHNQRSNTFFEAQNLLDHQLEELHDVEVNEGIVSSLCFQLGYLLDSSEVHGEDVGKVFFLISLVYQCSDSVRETCFYQLGNELLTMCHNSFQSLRETKHFDWSLHQIVKVLKALSRLRSASITMIQQGGCMRILQSILSKTGISSEARYEAVMTLKNISFYADNFRLLMIQHPGLLDVIIHSCLDSEGGMEMKEHISAILWNLAMAPDTKIPMAEHSCLLDLLVQLTEDYNPKTKRNAVNAISSLVVEGRNSMIFVTHGEGVILEIMKRLVEEDSDPVVRQRAARALRYFGRRDTVEMIVNYRGIIDALCRVGMNDSSVETQVEAIGALACYVKHAHGMTPYYSNIMNSIIKIARSSRSACCIEALAKTMNGLAYFESNRLAMVNHCALLKTLTSIATHPLSTTLSNEFSASALHNLSCEDNNKSTMSSSYVLRTLISLASNERVEALVTRSYAVKALVNLATLETNRKCMAQETGLLRCLIHYATTTTGDVKDDVKATIINLTPSV